jgi:hypothetical protein
MLTHTKMTVAGLALSLFGLVQSQAGLVNNGTLPWGAHTGPGNQYYVKANAFKSGSSWVMQATMPGSNGKKYNSGCVYDDALLKLTGTKAIGAQAYVNIYNAKTKGTWPAFWTTTTGGWTGEVDIAEWKGSTTIWQNTYDGAWENKLTPGQTNNWYKTHIQAKSATSKDAWVYLYIANNWVATHTGTGFVGKSWYVMANLQMEGSSGSPGPSNAAFSIDGYTAWGY